MDFLWERQRLIVETDGFRYHRGRIAFEQDRARDRRLRGLGYQGLRLTHRQLSSDSLVLARVLRQALTA